MNKFIKTVSESEVCYEFLRGLNGLMGLTDRELEVFALFVKLRLQDIKDKRLIKLSVARTENRKIVMGILGISKDNVSKYVGAFIRAGLMVRDKGGRVNVMESLIPDIIGGKLVQTTIIIKIQDNV